MESDIKPSDEDICKLMQLVPTDKATVFAYPIDWDMVSDHNIIEKKLRPWVKKKVTEYLGREEQGMIEVIMRKVSTHASPDIILAVLQGLLVEEAKKFTLEMWRVLVFEVLRASFQSPREECADEDVPD